MSAFSCMCPHVNLTNVGRRESLHGKNNAEELSRGNEEMRLILSLSRFLTHVFKNGSSLPYIQEDQLEGGGGNRTY